MFFLESSEFLLPMLDTIDVLFSNVLRSLIAVIE